MFSAVKSLPIHTKPAVSTFFATPRNFAGKASPVVGTVRFRQASAGTQEPDNMEKEQPEKNKKNQQTQEPEYKGDLMSHSFGEGYATRSDEEGFGGVYGRNQCLSHDEDKIVHGNCPEYDKMQGSEVKEKEKARHQTHDKP